MNIINIKENLHDERILAVISHSQYMPTKEKLNKLADEYELNPDVFAFARYEDDTVSGIIILKRIKNEDFEIISIAVSPNFRKQGIASSLISFALKNLKCAVLKAETDDDAVGFYRSFGFNIETLGEKYPGVVRYLCTLEP